MVKVVERRNLSNKKKDTGQLHDNFFYMEHDYLVKYARQIGSLDLFNRDEHKQNISNHQPPEDGPLVPHG